MAPDRIAVVSDVHGNVTAYEAVLADVKRRDHLDSTRAVSPLRAAEDAIVVDDGAPGGPTSYNFGFFDLAEDGFIGRFIRGEMEYQLVALPLRGRIESLNVSATAAVLLYDAIRSRSS